MITFDHNAENDFSSSDEDADPHKKSDDFDLDDVDDVSEGGRLRLPGVMTCCYVTVTRSGQV